MRKASAFSSAVVLAGAVFLVATPAGAEPSAKCGSTVVAAAATDGPTSALVCAPGVGATTVAVRGSGGYMVADGDSTNPEFTSGWIGVDDKGIIVCGSGDYGYPAGGTCNPQP